MCGLSDLVLFEDKIRRARFFVRIESNLGAPGEAAGTVKGLEAKIKAY
jgi:hypothetical protein